MKASGLSFSDLGKSFPKWWNTVTIMSRSWIMLEGGGGEAGEEQAPGSCASPGREVSEAAGFSDRHPRGPAPHPAPGLAHMPRFCLAFSMSFLISGVMLNRSFLGMGRGTMGDRAPSAFFLHGHGRGLMLGRGNPAHPGVGCGGWVPKAGGASPAGCLGVTLLRSPQLSGARCRRPGPERHGTWPRSRSWAVADPECHAASWLLQKRVPPSQSHLGSPSPGTGELGEDGEPHSRVLDDVIHE